MARLASHLPYRFQDLNWILDHPDTLWKCQAWCTHCALARGRQEDPWSSLAGQLSLTGELQGCRAEVNTQSCPFCLLPAHIPTRTHICIYMYVEAQFRNGCQKKTLFLLRHLSMTVSIVLSFLDSVAWSYDPAPVVCAQVKGFVSTCISSQRIKN